MHNGAMNTDLTPSPEVRLTIPVSAEVHQTFTRISKAGGIPVGRAMGEWLADTLDAAAFMAEKMEQARSAPKLVAMELHSYALGLSDMTKDLMAALKKQAAAEPEPEPPHRTGSAPFAPFGLKKRTLTPPSSNTGGKVPTKGKKKAGD